MIRKFFELLFGICFGLVDWVSSWFCINCNALLIHEGDRKCGVCNDCYWNAYYEESDDDY